MSILHKISQQDTTFLIAFAASEISLENFHHHENIKLAYILLVKNDFETSYAQLKSLLQNYLKHNGVPPEKYHVTMTRAWLFAVVHFMHKTESSNSSVDFIAQNKILLDPEIMFSHYSRDI